MNEHLKVNREYWNELTPIHAKSRFYDVAGFKSGKSTLTPIELEELGERLTERESSIPLMFSLMAAK